MFDLSLEDPVPERWSDDAYAVGGASDGFDPMYRPGDGGSAKWCTRCDSSPAMPGDELCDDCYESWVDWDFREHG